MNKNELLRDIYEALIKDIAQINGQDLVKTKHYLTIQASIRDGDTKETLYRFARNIQTVIDLKEKYR